MSSSKILITLLISLQLIVASTATEPLFHICSTTTGNNITSSQLTTLLSLLTSPNSTLSTTGFSTATLSNPSAYSLSLCRGDTSSSACQSCAANATTELLNLCPSNDAAVIWYDDCLVKYSDSDFFSKIDEANRFYLWNVYNISSPEKFNERSKGLLRKLSVEAVDDVKLFASGAMQIDTFTKIYGLVQCTRDLSSGDCKICLDDAIAEIPVCCDGKRGGRVVGASCNFRYEIYPFFNN